MKKSPYIVMLVILLALAFIYELRPFFQPGYPYFHTTLFNSLCYNVIFTTACLGGACAYWFLLPIRRQELFVTTIVGILLDSFFINYKLTNGMIFDPVEDHVFCIVDIGPGLLIAAAAAILWRAFQAYRRQEFEQMQKILEVFSLAVAMPIVLSLGVLKFDPYVYDPHCYALDSLWGVQVSFIITKIIRGSLPLCLFMKLAYFYLSFYMIVAQILIYKDNERLGLSHSRYLMPALLFIFIGLFGTFLYKFFPVVGVEVYCGLNSFPNGPWPAANMSPVPIEAPSFLPHNGMPSLHMAWILAVYYSLYRFYKNKPYYKYIALILIILTALSAFSEGCHYLIDLIIAIPFTLAILAFTMVEAPRKWRLTSALFGAIATTGWLSLFKYSITTALSIPTLTLALLVLTDIISLYLANTMCQQAKQSTVTDSSNISRSKTTVVE